MSTSYHGTWVQGPHSPSCDVIYNQVPRASNHMHLVQLSLLYISKGVRLKGNSFYKIQNRDGTRRRRPRTKPKALNPLPFTCPGTSIATVPKPHSDKTRQQICRWSRNAFNVKVFLRFDITVRHIFANPVFLQ